MNFSEIFNAMQLRSYSIIICRRNDLLDLKDSQDIFCNAHRSVAHVRLPQSRPEDFRSST